jgi:6-phosphogluconolactonase
VSTHHQPERGGALLSIHPDAHAASRAVAHGFAERASRAVGEHGRFAVALTGGSGPVKAYDLLADDPFRSCIPWNEVHLFWGDERCVPPGHERSNYRMASEAFIHHVPIPPENVHRMRGELPPEEGAARYAEELAAFFGSGVPRFDLVHLGVGPDAHVASLFPFSEPLRERDRTVTTNLHRPLGEPRITLTLPVLNAAARVEVIVIGRSKADVAWTVLRGPLDPYRFPAQLVRPKDGELAWMMDADAAARLDPHPLA